MRVAIIGAGGSGLGAAKIFAEHGHKPTIFEKSDKLGGIWTVCYPDASLQNRYHEYAFSDFPHKKGVSLHPVKHEVLEYMDSYATHFKLKDMIKFKHQVLSMEHLGPQNWEIKVLDWSDPKNKIEKKFTFEYVIIAKGQFCDNRNFPVIVQQQIDLKKEDRVFKGEILHDRDFTDYSQIQDKDVLIIGFGKTALDISTQASRLSNSSHLLFKEPRWIIPKYLLGIHYADILFARHGSYFMDSWKKSPLQNFIHTYLPFIPYLFWRMIELLFCICYGLGFGHIIVPKERFSSQFRSAVSVSPDGFFKQMKNGRIIPHKGQIASFAKDGVVLEDDSFVKCDVIISATGFKFDLDILPQYKHLLRGDGLHTYRHLVHPDIPDLAFAGFNHSFMHFPTLELGMHWVLAVIDGRIKLPSREEQLNEISRVAQWKDKNMLYETTRSCTVGPRFFSYFDELYQDLGIDYKRKGSIVTEWLAPMYSSDMSTVGKLLKVSNINKKSM